MNKKSIIEKALLDLQRKSLNTPAVKAHFLGSEKHCSCHDIVFEYSNGTMNETQINKKLIAMELAAMERAVGLTEAIIRIVPKFAGKIPNKRFDTALKAIDRNLSFKMQYNSFVIDFFVNDRSFDDNGIAHYIKDHTQNIIHASIRSQYNDGICPDGTINGDTLINALNKSIEYKTAYIKKITAELANLDEIIKKYNDIRAAQEDFITSTSYITRGYFNLKF